MIARIASVAAISLSAISCIPAPTEGRPPMVEEAGTYSAVLSSAWNTGNRLRGTAEIDTAANGSTVVRLLTDDPGRDVTIEFFSGLNGTGVFDFVVGEHSLVGIPGVQKLNALVTISDPTSRSYYAGTGYLEIVESSATGIVARFDFDAASVLPKEYITMWGSFSALPAGH